MASAEAVIAAVSSDCGHSRSRSFVRYTSPIRLPPVATTPLLNVFRNSSRTGRAHDQLASARRRKRSRSVPAAGLRGHAEGNQPADTAQQQNRPEQSAGKSPCNACLLRHSLFFPAADLFDFQEHAPPLEQQLHGHCTAGLYQKGGVCCQKQQRSKQRQRCPQQAEPGLFLCPPQQVPPISGHAVDCGQKN